MSIFVTTFSTILGDYGQSSINGTQFTFVEFSSNEHPNQEYTR